MINGEYFAAGTSLGKPATLKVEGETLVLAGNGHSRIFNLDTITISQRLAHVPRRLHFPDNSMFSTLQNEQLDQALKSSGREPAHSWISFFETGWRWTLLALVVIPVVLYLLFTIGMPIVAGPMATLVPESIKDDLDQSIIEFFDNRMLEPSTLSKERQSEVMALTKNLTRYSVYKDSKLIFRGGGFLGANALALPGGTIIFTDEIVELADNEGELAAVFAHELGHVQNNHSMRNVIQSAGVTFVLGWMLGDMTLITDMVLVGVPVLLQKMSYSRNFEREADEYSFMILEYAGFSSNCFADIMEKLARQNNAHLVDFPDYLSSHPPPQERIAMARSGKICSQRKQAPGRKERLTSRPTFVASGGPIQVEMNDIGKPDIGLEPDAQWSGVIDVENGDYAALVKHPPQYPRQALIEGIAGYCVIEYTVTSEGSVREPKVVEDQCSNPLFIPTSLEATLKFQYRPRIVDSQAVDVHGVQNKFTYEIVTDPPNN